MNRILLLVAIVAAALLVASRLAREPSPAVPQVAAAAPPNRAPALAGHSAPIVAAARTESLVAPPAGAGTPIISRLARIEARRRLTLAGSATYLDSLFTVSDSTLRRWDDRSVIRVAIAIPSVGGGALIDAARSGLRFWELVGLGVSFVDVPDTTGADIVVDWVDRFEAEPDPTGQPGRTGLTAIRSNERAVIETARITLARSDTRGAVLGLDVIRSIATHEFGHALGLPHSGRRDDIMYPTVLATQPSGRDRATAALLYALPPGTLREPADP